MVNIEENPGDRRQYSISPANIYRKDLKMTSQTMGIRKRKGE